MERFTLNEKQKISTLSKGMRMKFSLALALSHNADLLIMDEPTSGLDPLIRSELMTAPFLLPRIMRNLETGNINFDIWIIAPPVIVNITPFLLAFAVGIISMTVSIKFTRIKSYKLI